MASNLRIFHQHKPLAYLEAPVTPRSWVLNGFGRAEFTASLHYLTTKFPSREEAVMQYNNLVFIEHIPSRDAAGTVNGKLPDWVGIILPDRNWNFGTLGATVYSAEAILTFRPMPLTKISGTPADMFKQMLGFAQSAPALAGLSADIVIQPGIIEDVPETYSDNLATSAYDHIQKLCANARMNWDVTAQVDTKGKLQLYANLYQWKGNTSGYVLNRSNSSPFLPTDKVLHSDNVEGGGPLLTEQGTPYNVIYGYSSADSKESRYFAIGINQKLYNKIGFMAINHVFSGITDQTALQNAAQTMADNSPPLLKFRRVALDIGKTFDSLATGNTVTVKDTTVGFKPGGGFGFEAQARILALDYNDLTTGKAPLQLEII